MGSMTNSQLMTLLKLLPTMSQDEMTSKIDTLIDNQSDQSIIDFLEQSKIKLQNNKPSTTTETDYPAESFKSQYINQNNQLGKVGAPNIVATERGAQLQTSNPSLKARNTEIEQGSHNPFYIEKYQSSVIAKSVYRINPLSTDSSQFIVDIQLKNVISIRLTSIIIPPSWYPFDFNFANLSFAVSNGTDISCIDITPGFYDASSLLLAINQQLSNQGIISVTFNYTPLTNRVDILNGSIIDLSFIFYDNDITFNNPCQTSSCPNNTTSRLNQNLGYYLGFRQDATNPNPNSLIINLPQNTNKIAQAQLNLNTHINAILSIDDFNNNVFAEKVRLVETKDNRLALPSYYNKDIPCAVIPNTGQVSRQVAVLASNPRTLSIAQLVTINTIQNQDTNTYTISAKKVTNTIAILPLIANQYYSRSFRYDEASYKKYLGPVTIERLKLSLQDSDGNVLNLNSTDWECVLDIEQQY